jgi:hypothetical protein
MSKTSERLRGLLSLLLELASPPREVSVGQ